MQERNISADLSSAHPCSSTGISPIYFQCQARPSPRGVRAAYLCDGLIYSRVGVFVYDIKLQVMTQTIDGGQASFYLNIAKFLNRGSS
jgi:hypothetical protein